MDLRISGRVAVVTGGDSGMGFGTVRILLGEGMKVVLTDRVEDRLEAAAMAFLCSERASFITGANHRVDGGSVFTAGR